MIGKTMKHLVLVFVIVLISAVNGYSVTYYVDNVTGSDQNTGTSETKAWRTIAKVNAVTFSTGDKILFKRGGIWFEMLTLNGHGAPGYPIIISNYGLGILPIIDGGLVRTQCIVVQNTSYITVSGLKMQNAIRQGAIRVLRSNNIIIDNCEFLVTGHGGVFIEESRDCLIKSNNIVSQSGLYNVQTDGIYSQRNSNITFDNNHIVILNEHPEQHCDGIQSFKDNNLTICNNYVEQNNRKTEHAQGIYATNMLGTHTYYNNVVYCPNTKSSVVGFRNLTEGRGYLKLYNNTLVGGGNNILFISENAGVDAKNNIFYTTSRNTPVHLETGNVISDHNLYYTAGKGNIVSPGKGQSRSVMDLRKEGREIHGIADDPKFTKDFKLKSDSPAIDTGTELGPPFDFDKDGTRRNRGFKPDIGAYEFPK